jgi:glycosyltransferase involved in cell wall biosynthesis
MNKIDISVCIITYNHQKFIAKAIDSVLMQSTEYNIEIILGDDCSTDCSTDICKSYEDKYKNVRLLKRDKNIGMNANWMDTIRSANGKYIALLEGDDYWIDKYKLQKQVTFLEKNKDYVLCSHELYIDNPYLNRGFFNFASLLYRDFKLSGFNYTFNKFLLFFKNSKEFWKLRRHYGSNKRYSVGNLRIAIETVFDKGYIHTSTMVAEATVLKTMPDEAFSFAIGHGLSVLWTAMHGKQKHLFDVMTVRQIHEDCSAITKRENKIKSSIERKKIRIKLFELLNKYKKSEFFLSKINQLKTDIKYDNIT